MTLPPAHQVRSASSNNTNDDLKPWTASRCHRLLRQLQSRLVTLRKLFRETRKVKSERPSKRSSPNQDHCCVEKRIRYTYAQRRRPLSCSRSNDASITVSTSTPQRTVRPLGEMRLNLHSPVAGRIDFPTPILRKIHDRPATPSPTAKLSSASDDKERRVPTKLMEELYSLRRLVPEDHHRIYEAIYGWLNNLLQLTIDKTPPVHPKSLLGICLRKIPACISEIEAWERQALETNDVKSMWHSSQVSQDIYGQLEAFGSAKTGWQPLKLALRAHAISILADAVAEGILEPAFVGLLAQLCLHHGCSEEAAKLILQLRTLAAPLSSSSTFAESSSLRPLNAIVASFNGRETPGAIFGCLSELVRTKRLSVDWLSTRGFRGIWTSSLEAMTSNGQQPTVVDFMITTLKHLVLNGERKSRHGVKERTLISMAAGITAAVLTLGSEMNVNDKGPRRRQVRRRLVHILDECISLIQSRHRPGRPATREGGLFILTLARYLALAGDRETEPTAQRHAQEECKASGSSGGEARIQSQYRQALLLVCAVAQCRGRACAVPCHDVLSEICAKLEGSSFPDWFRTGLMTDGAFVLAQTTKSLQDLAFAESLNERLKRVSDPPTKISTMFAGWRWEEGISEWVVDGNGASSFASTRLSSFPRVGKKVTAGGIGERQNRRCHAGTSAGTIARGAGRGSDDKSGSGMLNGGGITSSGVIINSFSFSGEGGGNPSNSSTASATLDELLFGEDEKSICSDYGPQEQIIQGSTTLPRITGGRARGLRLGVLRLSSQSASEADDWDELS